MSATSCFLAMPSIPSNPGLHHTDFPGKPLQPTSTDRFQAFHPFCWLSRMNSWYFVHLRSCASILSSQGTVNSISTTCLVLLDQRTISGLRLTLVISSGNLSCFFRSTRISQSLAMVKIPLLLVSATPASPALRKWINQGAIECCLGFFLACSIPTAIWARIWSCRHRNFPSARLERHKERTCSRLAGLPQSVQLGLSANPHVCRFDGVGRTSYTEHSRNLIWCPSMLWMSW